MPQPPQPPRPPGGVTTTYDLDGPGTPDDSGIFDLGVGVVPADDRRDVDFAYAGTGSIGDTVWFDLDMDGILDAGFGIEVVASPCPVDSVNRVGGF